MRKARKRILLRYYVSITTLTVLAGIWIYYIVRKDNRVCTKIDVHVHGTDMNIYSPQTLIEQLLQTQHIDTTQPLKQEELEKMKTFFTDKLWIRAAHLFFTSRHHLQIHLHYRLPVAKIYFYDKGQYAYLDKDAFMLPPIAQTSIRVPVILAAENNQTIQDSSFRSQLLSLLRIIESDKICARQFKCIHIENNNNTNVILQKRNIKVMLGTLTNIPNKIHRFRVFCQNGYLDENVPISSVDLRFTNQLITK